MAEQVGQEDTRAVVDRHTSRERSPASGWTLLSNHGHVLVCIAADPDIHVRDIAEQVGITERAVFGIVNDLEAAGYVERVREGRRNHYVVHGGRPLRHPLEGSHTVADLLRAVVDLSAAAPAAAAGDPADGAMADTGETAAGGEERAAAP